MYSIPFSIGINPVMYLLISAGGMMALCWGFLNFLPKYIENQFHQSVSDSSMYAGKFYNFKDISNDIQKQCFRFN